MNVSTNETQPNSDACLLPVTHIIALILVNLLSIIIGTTGNALVIATVYTNVDLADYFKLLVGEHGRC